MRREAERKKKKVSHVMVTEYIQLELKSAHQTPGLFARDLIIPKTRKAGPSGCSGLEEQQEEQDLVKMSFHPVIALKVFPSPNVRGRRKLSFHGPAIL